MHIYISHQHSCQALGVSGSKSVSNYRVNYWLGQPKIGDFVQFKPKKASRFWGLLTPKMVISKLSGNTVRHDNNSLTKILTFDTFNQKIDKIDLKFEIFDLKYHYFDTKNVQFGDICGLDVQTEVYYGLGKIEVVLGWRPSKFAKNGSKISRYKFQDLFF